MGLNDDLFTDTDSPLILTLDQRAKATLDDMVAVMPYDGGDALDALWNEVIDEGALGKEILRLLVSGDALEAERLAKNKAAHVAYSKAREQECVA